MVISMIMITLSMLLSQLRFWKLLKFPSPKQTLARKLWFASTLHIKQPLRFPLERAPEQSVVVQHEAGRAPSRKSARRVRVGLVFATHGVPIGSHPIELGLPHPSRGMFLQGAGS